MKTITLLLILLLSNVGFAQMGIGTTAPDASAALDVESTEKGFLPPRMTEADRNAITMPAAGLIIWCTNCGSDGEAQVFNGNTWTNMIGGAAATPPPPQVGDFRDGGVVFYVAPAPTDLNGDGDLDTGLVCAIEDQSTGIQWRNGIYATTGATATAIGTGAANTITIIQAQGATQTDYAAGLANAYNGGNFNDWFLPSKDEINKMYQNEIVINATANSNGGSGFTNDFYWSSSELGKYSAWSQRFNNNATSDDDKSNLIKVRAVRVF